MILHISLDNGQTFEPIAEMKPCTLKLPNHPEMLKLRRKMERKITYIRNLFYTAKLNTTHNGRNKTQKDVFWHY